MTRPWLKTAYSLLSGTIVADGDTPRSWAIVTRSLGIAHVDMLAYPSSRSTSDAATPAASRAAVAAADIRSTNVSPGASTRRSS